jgi:hypothetical protein
MEKGKAVAGTVSFMVAGAVGELKERLIGSSDDPSTDPDEPTPGSRNGTT